MATPNIAATAISSPVNPAITSYLAGRLDFVVRASGRYAQTVASLRAERARAPSTPASAPESRGTQSRPQSPPAVAPPRPLVPQAPPRARTPVQAAIIAATLKGDIADALGKSLVSAVDYDENPAIRSEAANRAAFDLAKLENRSHDAAVWRNQRRGLENDVTVAKERHSASHSRVKELLTTIYEDPSQAASELSKLGHEVAGPGDLAQRIQNKPVGLGPLKGTETLGGYYKSEARARALAAVPTLAAELERRGRGKEYLTEQREALSRHNQRPANEPPLAASLKALRQIDAVQAVIPTSDPVTSTMLLEAAQEAAEHTRPEHLRDARDIPPAYRAYLTDQAQRLETLHNLQASRDPSRAFDNYITARACVGANLSAAEQLRSLNMIIPANTAHDMAQQAATEQFAAAQGIIADYAQTQHAAAAGLLPEVNQFVANPNGQDHDTDLAQEHSRGHAM